MDLFPGNKISLRDIDEFISKNRIDLKSNDGDDDEDKEDNPEFANARK